MSETANRLIDGAVSSMQRNGLAATTSRDITAAAGVNLAGITYHFGSKDELVAQALLAAIRRWLAPARKALQRGDDPLTRLLAAVGAAREALDEAADLLPVYVDALAHVPHNDTLKRGLDELRAELRGFLAGELVDLRASGGVPEWVEPEAMAALILAVADGMAVDASLSADPRPALDQFVRLLAAARPHVDDTPPAPRRAARRPRT